MESILFFAVTTALSAGAFAAGHRLARLGRRGALTGSAVALGLILLKAVLNAQPVWEATLFPHPAYVFFQDYWLYPAGLLFFGLVVPQLPVRWNRAVVAGLAACLFAWSLWAQHWMLLPPDDTSTQRATPRHFCRQTTAWTCAPASCVALLSHWGIDATEGEMARLCLTSPRGTTLFNVYRGIVLRVRKDGGERGRLRVRMVELTPEALRALDVPVVAGNGYHAVVLRYDGGAPVVIDPMGADGPRPLREATLRRFLEFPVVAAFPPAGSAALRPWRE
jgi:hypothetical protein